MRRSTAGFIGCRAVSSFEISALARFLPRLPSWQAPQRSRRHRYWKSRVSAGNAVEPSIERFVQVLAGGRGPDRRAHHDEHRNSHQGKLVEPRPEGLGDDMKRYQTPGRSQGRQRDGAEAEGHRDARQQHQQRDDENGGAFEAGLTGHLRGLLAHSRGERLSRLVFRDAERRRAPRHQGRATRPGIAGPQDRVRSASRDRESRAARARRCWTASLRVIASYQ